MPKSWVNSNLDPRSVNSIFLDYFTTKNKYECLEPKTGKKMSLKIWANTKDIFLSQKERYKTPINFHILSRTSPSERNFYVAPLDCANKSGNDLYLPIAIHKPVKEST